MDEFNINLAKKLQKIDSDYLHLYFATRKKNTSKLKINNIESAVDSLLRAEEHIKQVEGNVFHWKWVILCLQNSLYTFSLSLAAGSNWTTVLKIPKKYKKLINDPNEINNIPFHKFNCIDFLIAIKRCIGLQYFVTASPLQLTDNQKNSILWLHDHFRNNFEHFTPQGWGISLYGIPNICVDVLEVIQFIAIDGKHIIYKTKTKKKKTISSINKSIKLLKKSKFYDSNYKIKEHSKLHSAFN